jgi:parallel beta-helix repeat protein
VRWSTLPSAIVSIILTTASLGVAHTIHVPADQPTIQVGINAAVDGDTVLVADGTYTGEGNRDIDFLGKAIVVMSENGPDSTMIDCEGDSLDQHRGFICTSYEDSGSVIQGFTIRAGYVCGYPDEEGGAIYCLFSSPTIKDNRFVENRASYGSVLYCEYAAPNVTGNTIEGNVAAYGATILCNQASPIIRDNTILSNTAGAFGGGIYCWNSSPSIENNTFDGNRASAGGAIFCHNQSHPSIKENMITGNSAENYGGGIYCDWNSSPTIEGNTISQDSASYGGGISCTESSPIIQENTINGNAALYGGGIFCDESSPDVTNNTIADNIAEDGYGGGIHCSSSDPDIVGNSVTGNTSEYGGAVYCTHSSPLIEGNTITGNSASSNGGGISCCSYSSPIINENTITANGTQRSGSLYGGGIYCSHSYPTITGNEINENTATHGGGLCLCDSMLVENNIIMWNTAEWYGGGIYGGGSFSLVKGNIIAGNVQTDSHAGGAGISCSGSPTIEGNLILNNSGSGEGGGIRCTSNAAPIINENVISGNSSVRGGGLFLKSSSPTILGNTITHNTANREGGGLFLTTSSSLIAHSTIAGNIAPRGGGGIFCEYESNFPLIGNCIIWDNQPDQVQGEYPAVFYSDVEGGWQGAGNINTNPMFLLPEERDYRLLWGSPCIDAGYPDSLDADGTRSDMGAHFFDQDDYLTLYMTPDKSVVPPGGHIGVTYTLINRWSNPEQFWFTSQVHLPGGRTFAIIEPTEYTMPAEYVFQIHLVHDVPDAAPPGEYEYRSFVGLPPGALYDRDSFRLRIIE